MSKRFKLRFPRVIPSLQSLQFCRFKDPSSLPVTPVQGIHRLSPVNPKACDIAFPKFPDPPPSTPSHDPSIKRHVSSKTVFTGRECKSKSCTQYSTYHCNVESPEHTWKKESKCLLPRREISNLSDSGESEGDVSPSPAPETEKMIRKHKSNKKKPKKAKAKAKDKASVCTSSSSVHSGWSNSEASEETETIVSSRSFSNDSSCDLFSNQVESKTEHNKKKQSVKKARKLRRRVSKHWRDSTKAAEAPAPAMPRTVAGKVKESVAVVKKSRDPYDDFKMSMLEMILEKQMFDAKDLEELLHCFLYLNSRNHHQVIVEAFSEIWGVLFRKSPVNQRGSMCQKNQRGSMCPY